MREMINTSRLSTKDKRIKFNETIHVDSLSIAKELSFRIHHVKHLTDDAFVVRFDRNGLEFTPGQYITIGLPGYNRVREYSIYSAVHQPWLEVLVKRVDDGLVSTNLSKLRAGDFIVVEGPFGCFTLDEEKMSHNKYLFVGTGTGIAPFHSIINSYSDFDYTLLHGISTLKDVYEQDHYPTDKFVLCTSRDVQGDYFGRVTDYLHLHDMDFDSLVYLCGNSDMIYEVYDILTSNGFQSNQIKTEVYF